MYPWLPSLNRHKLLPTADNHGAPSKTTPHPDPHSWVLYILALLPTIIIVLLTFLFYVALHTYGTIPATHSLAVLANHHPRITAQVAIILGSFLTSVIKWSLSRAATLIAQKRLLQFRTIFEIEFWTSIKNGGILWTWKLDPKRWLATLTTTTLVVLCGLMTSGFASLLSPLEFASLPVQVVGQALGGPELDYTANSTACSAWLKVAMQDLGYVDDLARHAQQAGEIGVGAVSDNQAPPSCSRFHQYKDFVFNDCTTISQSLDALEAGRASMLAHVFSNLARGDPRKFVSTLSSYGDTRILGSTAGVLPMGPGGIGAFEVSVLTSGSSHEPLNMNATYRLALHGISCDVSCQYVDPSTLPYQLVSNSASRADTTCPGGKKAFRNIPAGNNILVMDYCPSTNGAWTLNLASSSIVDKVINASASSDGVYAGVGSMSCSIAPRARIIHAIYDLDLDAFTMQPLDDSYGAPQIPLILLQHIIHRTWKVIEVAQVGGSANIAASILDNVAVMRQRLPSMQRDPGYPSLVASMIKGIYEYQATHLRLVLAVYGAGSIPLECMRLVSGTAAYRVVGWKARDTTFLALAPLGLVGVIVTLLISWAIWIADGLRVFDPTNAISLIATASAGGVHFDTEVVGEPDDEIVRNTVVKYQEISKLDPARWGLVMQDNVETDMLLLKSGAFAKGNKQAP